MDNPSLQLQTTIRDSIQHALASQRPILTHLNADTTWLLQLPYPSSTITPLGRSRFNILFDPWLRGPQSDVASWFSSQWHTTESSVQTISDLEMHLYEIERLAHLRDKAGSYLHPVPMSGISYIDAVVISHEFTDHCNKNTLLEVDANVPVFATRLAATKIRSWRYFELVHEIPPFYSADPDWRLTCLPPLPKWIGISRIVTQSDTLYYHSAVLVTFDLQNTSREMVCGAVRPAEAVIYSPHGIHASDLRYLPSANPPVEALVLLHGLHDIKISVKQLNLGAHNGLQAQRICNAKYWISTHDEIKKGSGFIAPFLYRRVLTLKEAYEREKGEAGQVSDESKLAAMREVTFAELANGESLLLV